MIESNKLEKLYKKKDSLDNKITIIENRLRLKSA